MPSLPPSSDITAAPTQVAAQSAFAAWRGHNAGLLGEDGTQATALATLGALGGRYLAKTAAYSVVTGDRGAVIDATSGTWTLSLLAAASAGAGFSVAVINSGTGVITIDPSGSETIDGATTQALLTGSAFMLVCTGTAWVALALPGKPQAHFSDATPGRLMRVAADGGSFGWGNLGALDILTDIDAITIPSGLYRYGSSTAGTKHPDFATGFGLVEVLVSQVGTVTQRAMRNTISGLNGGLYRRVYSSGAWSAWDVSVMRSSLLGTVSQSAGVPTGAVIQRGSNANGEFVRFADGTQICTRGTLSTANASTATGALFRSADIAWTFPAAFVDTTHLVVQADSDDADCWGAVNGLTTTGCNVRLLSAVTKGSTLVARAVATGRWF